MVSLPWKRNGRLAIISVCDNHQVLIIKRTNSLYGEGVTNARGQVRKQVTLSDPVVPEWRALLNGEVGVLGIT